MKNRTKVKKSFDALKKAWTIETIHVDDIMSSTKSAPEIAIADCWRGATDNPDSSLFHLHITNGLKLFSRDKNDGEIRLNDKIRCPLCGHLLITNLGTTFRAPPKTNSILPHSSEEHILAYCANPIIDGMHKWLFTSPHFSGGVKHFYDKSLGFAYTADRVRKVVQLINQLVNGSLVVVSRVVLSVRTHQGVGGAHPMVSSIINELSRTEVRDSRVTSPWYNVDTSIFYYAELFRAWSFPVFSELASASPLNGTPLFVRDCKDSPKVLPFYFSTGNGPSRGILTSEQFEFPQLKRAMLLYSKENPDPKFKLIPFLMPARPDIDSDAFVEQLAKKFKE